MDSHQLRAACGAPGGGGVAGTKDCNVPSAEGLSHHATGVVLKVDTARVHQPVRVA